MKASFPDNPLRKICLSNDNLQMHNDYLLLTQAKIVALSQKYIQFLVINGSYLIIYLYLNILIYQISQFDKMEHPKCLVCFINPYPLSQHQQIITCLFCKATAHRFCYLPNSTSNDFICDACQSSFKGVCYLCQNEGLLKKIDSNFAHPMCLFFNASVLIQRFDDLTFTQIDTARQGKKMKCLQCGKSNNTVISCIFNCSKNVHIYCAIKKFNAADNTGWKLSLNIFKTLMSNYEVIDNLVNRSLSAHNKFLKKKLSLGKLTKKILPVTIYCQEHSLTAVECMCKTINILEQDLEWIFCDSCCRWQHVKCLDNQQTAKEAIQKGLSFMCCQCQMWKNCIAKNQFVRLQQFPKMHIYDFVYIHLHFEKLKYKTSANMLEFIQSIPVLPGKIYIQTEYRKEIYKKLRAKIDLQTLKKQIQSQNKQSLPTLFIKEKEKLQLIWWLAEGQLINKNSKKYFPHLLDEQNFTPQAIMTIFDLLIKYQTKFFGPNFVNCLQELKLKLTADDKKEEPLKSQSKQSIIINSSDQPIIKNLNKTLKVVLSKLMNTKQRTPAFIQSIIKQVHQLLNKQQIKVFRDFLPKILITQASILFPDKNSSVEYITKMTKLDSLSSQWKQVSQAKFTTTASKMSQEQRMCSSSERLLENIISYKDPLLRQQLVKQWTNLQCNLSLPSRQKCFKEMQIIPSHLKESNVTLEQVELLYNSFLMKSSSFPQDKQLKKIVFQYSILLKVLQFLKSAQFTERQMKQVREKIKQLEKKGKQYELSFRLLQNYMSLYCQTEDLMKQQQRSSSRHLTKSRMKKSKVSQEQLFKRLEVFKSAQSLNSIQQHIAFLIKYLDTIKNIRFDLFKQNIKEIIRKQVVWIVQKVESRRVIFENQQEFVTIKRYCNFLKIKSKKIAPFIQEDSITMAKLKNCIPNFDKVQTINMIETLITQSLPFYQNNRVTFRVNKLKIILSWIDLFKKILTKMPPKLLLPQSQLKFLDICPQSQKIDFYLMREIYRLMIQFKFPSCHLLQKLAGFVQQGEVIEGYIEKVLLKCKWTYDLSQAIDWQSKMTFQEFKTIHQISRAHYFSFEVESIELDIIKDKFKNTENMANLLLIEYRKPNYDHTSYSVEKIKQFVIAFGSYPIKSQLTNQLLQIMKKPILDILQENMEEQVENIVQSFRIHCWQQIEYLKTKISKKNPESHLKVTLEKLIKPFREFNSAYSDILTKFSKQQQPFTLNQMKVVQQLCKKYLQHSILDLEIGTVLYRFQQHQYISNYMRWQLNYGTDLMKIIVETIGNMHICFMTEEVHKFRNRIEEHMKVKETNPRQEKQKIYQNFTESDRTKRT